MVTHSSVLAWRIPGTGGPGRLPSMGSHRVGHDWSDLALALALALVCILEKDMATHSSALAWRIPWTEGPGGLRSMGSRGVGHDWATSLSFFTLTFHFHALEQEMATHPSVLAWRIPGTGEPGGLPSIGSHRVGHDWSNLVVVVNPKVLIYPSPSSFPFGNHKFVFCVYESVSVL